MAHNVARVPVVVIAVLVVVAGCGRQERPVVFEPNLVHAMKYQIKDNVSMDQASSDTTWLVQQMFGTPDSPELPAVITDDEELSPVLSMERLQRASGPFGEGRGLYRKHCATCHGVSGNGRGIQAAVLNPYPRDYRMGIFKFKSTKRGSKPTRNDLAKLISNGITGTAMKKIPELTDEDVQALTDYVIYLSMRGQLERAMIDGAALELDLEGGDRVIDTEFGAIYLADKALVEKLAAVNEETEADELVDFDNYNAFAERLESEPALREKLVAGGVEATDALAEYLLKRYQSAQQLSLELNKIADDPVEVDEDTTAAELADSLAKTLADKYEDHLDFGQELQEDPELKKRLEEASAKTSGQQLKQYELFVEAWEYAEDTVAELAAEWLDAENNVFDVPEPPSYIPIADSYEEFVALSQGDQAETLAESVKRGKELFVGTIANCGKCHGMQGRGDGQTADYDDWTKDWTSRVGLRPEQRDSLIPLLARGALPPIHAKPRNMEDGLYHGGSTAADLYRRIMMGIEGTPMPAATFVEGKFEQDDVWHLINYVRSLQKAPAEEPAVSAQASL